MIENFKEKRLTYDKKITALFLTILVVTLIYNIIFQNGSKVSRILLTIVSIIGTYLFFKITFLKKSKAAYILSLGFIMISMYLGNILNFYTYIPSYDKILHLASGVIIGFVSIVIYAYFTKGYIDKLNPMFIVFFSITFTIACAGTWEIWEFTTDRLFGLQSQCNSLVDTMTDIICGTIGGLISLIWIYIFAKRGKNKIIKMIIDEITK